MCLGTTPSFTYFFGNWRFSSQHLVMVKNKPTRSGNASANDTRNIMHSYRQNVSMEAAAHLRLLFAAL